MVETEEEDPGYWRTLRLTTKVRKKPGCKNKYCIIIPTKLLKMAGLADVPRLYVAIQKKKQVD